eukprot:g2220.t1
MLEANLPPEVLPKSTGELSIQLFVPPVSTPLEIDFDLGDKETEDTTQEEAPLQLQMLTVDHVLRWQGECAENDKGLVLCERITVPPETGDVTSTLRVTVEGLPQAFLRATLVAQMPPTDEMRPPPPEGAALEPLKQVGWRSSHFHMFFLLKQRLTFSMSTWMNSEGPLVLTAERGCWRALVPVRWRLGLMRWSKTSRSIHTEHFATYHLQTAAAARESWVAARSRGQDAEAAEEEESEDFRRDEKKQLVAALERTKKVKHPNTSIAQFLSCHVDTPALLIQEALILFGKLFAKQAFAAGSIYCGSR